MGPLGASIRALRPRCGLPDSTIPPVAQRVDQYSAISKALARSGVDSSQCTEEKLSNLIHSLRSFMDAHFGHNAPPETRTKLTMLPRSIFSDLSEFGPLRALLQACFQYSAEHRLAPLNFDDTKSTTNDLLKLIFHLEKILKKDHYFRVIKVFISPLLEQDETENIRDIAQRHGAAIVSNPHVATHLVYPDPDGTLEHQTDDQVLVRVLERTSFGDETFCFLHWLHHPDSYDDWVPASEVLGHVYVPRRRREREQWHIQARWLRDLELHNEWMNELDYEMPATFADFQGRSPKPPKLDASGKQKSALVRIRLRMPKSDELGRPSSQLEPSKRVGLPSLANGFNEDMADDDDGNHTFMNGSVLSDMNAADSGASDTPDDSGGSSSARGSDKSPGQTTKISVGGGVYIPFFSKWFSLQSVHDVERRALPEFFQHQYASKTDDTYREIRNFIVKTWRQNNNEYLSGTAVRRHLAGDACAILRLHGFLEHWGLINYECSTQGAAPASFIPPPRPLPLQAGHERDYATLSGPSLVLDDGSKLAIKGGRVAKLGRNDEVLRSGRTEAVLIRDSDRTGQASSIAEPPAREPIEYHCDSCGADCSALRFHCATKADVDLCAPCYQNAKYSSSMKPRDFIQMNSAGAHGGPDETDGDVWTESETLLLLEALEMYGDNWTLVSEHVGSKGKSQCVIQFLRLPIEDSFLSRTSKEWWGIAPPGNADEKSPVDMLRAAGARESALSSVNTSGAGAKTFSGQPLVFGDQISTIIPFAKSLASRCPQEIVKVITRVLTMGGTSRKRKRSYSEMLLQEISDAPPNDPPREESIREIVESFTTDRMYRKFRRMVSAPAKFLKTEQGEKLAGGAFSLVKHGAIPVTDMIQLRLDSSLMSLMMGPEAEPNQSAREATDDVLTKATAKEFNERQNGDASGNRMNPGSDRDPEASTAVAITSLAAASVSAFYRQEVEQAEIDRLFSLLSEVRVQIIERRLAHLTAISEYEDFAERYKQQKLSEEMARRMVRRTESVRSRTMEIEMPSDNNSALIRDGESSNQTMVVDQLSNLPPNTQDVTGEEHQSLDDARATLSGFSGEVSLQQIPGSTPDGRIIADEGVQMTTAAAPAAGSAQG